MKKNKARGFYLLVLLVISCSSSTNEIVKKSEDLIVAKKYNEAKILLTLALNDIKNEKQKYLISIKLARLYTFYLKDFKQSAIIYKQAIIYASDNNERIKPIESLARIYAKYLNKYSLAIYYFNMARSSLKGVRRNEITIEIIRNYIKLKKFYQARTEIKNLRRKPKFK